MAKNSEIFFLWLKNAISLNFLWLKNSKSLHWGRFGVDLVSVWCRFGVSLGFCVGEVGAELGGSQVGSEGSVWFGAVLGCCARGSQRCPNSVGLPTALGKRLCRTHARLHFSSLLLVFCGLHGLVRGVVGVCFSLFLTPLFS